MGFLDNLVNQATNALKGSMEHEARKAVNGAVDSAVKTAKGKLSDAAGTITGSGRNHSEKFTFTSLPASLTELQAMPEAKLDSPFKTTALVIAVLCNYEANPEATIEMLDFLNGPDTVNPATRAFLDERLVDAYYKPFSFFAGATPDNGYKPATPYKLTVQETPHSFETENWATLYVTSGGAENPRPIILRKKPSTGQWFVNDIQCLAEIRVPKAEDPWA